VPIELSSTYAAHPTLGADGVANNLGYGRASNSTWEAFEAAVGALEGGQALCFASGMAAISAALAVLPADGALVAPRTPYNTSGALIGEVEAAGREVRRVDVQDTAAVVAALDGAGAIWLESPTNPLMEVADLPVIIAAARSAGSSSSATTPSPLPCSSSRSPSAPTSSSTRRRSTSPATPTCSSGSPSRASAPPTGHPTPGMPRSSPTARGTGRSPGRSRCGWRCAAYGPCMCGWNAQVPTRPSSPGGSASTRR
jgi:hypothetical protein